MKKKESNVCYLNNYEREKRLYYKNIKYECFDFFDLKKKEKKTTKLISK